MSVRLCAMSLCGLWACATVAAESEDPTAPQAALALGRLLAPLATPEVADDLVRSDAWPGAQIREDGGVVQVAFGRPAERKSGFLGRFSLTRRKDQSWLVSIDELSDGRLRYWGTAEVQPRPNGLTLRLDLVILEGTRGGELVVSGRIRRVEGRWRLEARGVWNDGRSAVPVRVARGLKARPRLTSPPDGDRASDTSML